MAERPYAVVTGAASGIGFATAQKLASSGFGILAADVSQEGVDRAVAAVKGGGGEARGYCLDVRDEEMFRALLEDAVVAVGTPKALINVAGVGVAAPLSETSREDWERVIGINLTAVFLTCRVAIPQMVKAGGGVIVNVASVAGLVGVANRAAYCASKAGVIGLTRSIAVDYAAFGIRANAICPGTVETEWIDKILADAPDPAASRRAMEARQLDGRMGTPGEVAAGINFLVSNDGRFVNGTAFVMDGGMTAA